MAITSRRAQGRPRRPISVAKPSGSIHPRVQKVGPEHFGIVAVDCAKARSKWMLTDFYGNILIPPTSVEHTRRGLDDFVARIRQAMTDHHLPDLLVAIERTGNYHRPLQRTATAAGLEARIVHPLTSKQYRLPADPGNKTDDTDLAAIQRAAVNGFGLIEPVLDETHAQLRLLARHRRDLVRKNADLRNQIHAELDALFPGLSAAVARHLRPRAGPGHRPPPGLGPGDPRPGPRRAGRAAERRARAAISAGAWRRSWPGPIEPTSRRNARRLTSESSHIWMTSVAPGCERSGPWSAIWRRCWCERPICCC